MIRKYVMDIYPRALYVAIDEIDEAINAFLKGDQGDGITPMDEDSNAYELSVSDGEHGGSLIRFKTIEQCTQGIIAHESFHAAMRICEYLDISFTTREHEHIAYLLQWIVNKCYETKWEYEKLNQNNEIPSGKKDNTQS